MKILLNCFFLWNLYAEGKCWLIVAQAEEEISTLSNMMSKRSAIKEQITKHVKAFGFEEYHAT